MANATISSSREHSSHNVFVQTSVGEVVPGTLTVRTSGDSLDYFLESTAWPHGKLGVGVMQSLPHCWIVENLINNSYGTETRIKGVGTAILDQMILRAYRDQKMLVVEATDSFEFYKKYGMVIPKYIDIAIVTHALSQKFFRGVECKNLDEMLSRARKILIAEGREAITENDVKENWFWDGYGPLLEGKDGELSMSDAAFLYPSSDLYLRVSGSILNFKE